MSDIEIGCRQFHTFPREAVVGVSVWNGRDSLTGRPVRPADPPKPQDPLPASSLSPAQKAVLAFLWRRRGTEFSPRDIATEVGRSEAGVKEAALSLWRRGQHGVRRRRVRNERVFVGSWIRYWIGESD